MCNSITENIVDLLSFYQKLTCKKKRGKAKESRIESIAANNKIKVRQIRLGLLWLITIGVADLGY